LILTTTATRFTHLDRRGVFQFGLAWLAGLSRGRRRACERRGFRRGEWGLRLPPLREAKQEAGGRALVGEPSRTPSTKAHRQILDFQKNPSNNLVSRKMVHSAMVASFRQSNCNENADRRRPPGARAPIAHSHYELISPETAEKKKMAVTAKPGVKGGAVIASGAKRSRGTSGALRSPGSPRRFAARDDGAAFVL
jgi:hypothetical protein